uniref:Uncharacterized protein n=1 Tax=Plectus sambesii TaxID=2011161 RepID=A0A914WBP5_9BILA
MAPRNKRRASTSTNVRHGLKSPKKARHEERDENAATDDDANIDIWTVPSEEYSSSESGTDYEDDDKADRTVTGKSSDISDCIDSNRKPKVDKAAMAFPKGTYVIRLTDVTNNDCKWIWRIDNHQLIHKYVLEDNDVISQQMTSSKRRYVKSFR